MSRGNCRSRDCNRDNCSREPTAVKQPANKQPGGGKSPSYKSPSWYYEIKVGSIIIIFQNEVGLKNTRKKQTPQALFSCRKHQVAALTPTQQYLQPQLYSNYGLRSPHCLFQDRRRCQTPRLPSFSQAAVHNLLSCVLSCGHHCKLCLSACRLSN